MHDHADIQARRGIPARHLALVAAATLALFCAAAVCGWLALRPGRSSAAAAPVPIGAPLDPPEPPQALVFVSGAVANPGLYRLPAAARLTDAVAAAGGVTADADLGKLPDLAARVHDGRQVNVPFRRSSVSRAGTAPDGSPRVDVNTASADELRAVPGMPLGVPEAIVEARSLLGPFASLSVLRTTLGLDSTTLAGLRPYLRAGTSTR